MSKNRLVVAFALILLFSVTSQTQTVNCTWEYSPGHGPIEVTITVESPENLIPINIVYNTNSIPLTFRIDVEWVLWSSYPLEAFYVLDGQSEKVTLTSTGTNGHSTWAIGNTELKGLSEGSHPLIINYLNFSSKEILFTISKDTLPSSSPTLTPSPTESPSYSQSSSPSHTPTIEPTLAPKQTGFLGTRLPTEYGYAVVAVGVIVAAGLSLVYLKKLRK